MKIVVSGAHGLIGSALCPALREQGHSVVRLTRRSPQAPDEVQWDPAAGHLDPADLQGVEAAVNLSGAGIADQRWTPDYKRLVRSSRVDSTRTLATALAALDPAPRVLLSGSAVGFYGDTGDRVTDETAPAGDDFLARVCADWEAAAAPTIDAGIRTAFLRTGIVMAGSGGTLSGTVHAFGLPIKLLWLFKAGLAGPIGSGRQWVPWISLTDEVAAIAWLLGSDVSGPVNLVGPAPVTNREWVRAIGRAVHRPAVLPVPAPALRAAIGEFADAGVLVSQRVVPGALEAAGYRFRHPTVDEALAAEL